MTDPLRVERVQLEPANREPTKAMREAGVTPYHLTVTVTNTTNSAVSVVATSTQLFYDAEHRALDFSFGAEDKSGQPLGLRYAPRKLTVEPGGHQTIDHDLYSPVTFAGDPFHGIEERVVDLGTDVDIVECSIEFHEVQFGEPEAEPSRTRWAQGRWMKPSTST